MTQHYRRCASLALVFMMAAIWATFAGCGSNSRAPSSATASSPGASSAAPTKSPGSHRSATTAIEPAALPEAVGETLADTRRDLSVETNPAADSAGTGEWHYLASPTDNPWSSLLEAVLLPRDGGSALPRFALPSNLNSPVVLPNQQGEVLLVPPSRWRMFSVLRWVSGGGGEIAIQGRFRLGPEVISDVAELQIYVDGVLHFRDRVHNEQQRQGKTFDVRAEVLPGSFVDLVVEPNVLFEAEDGHPDEMLLTARIGRLSPVPDGLNVPEEIASKVEQRWRQSPRRPIPHSAYASRFISNPELRRTWIQERFLAPFRKRHAGSALDLAAGEDFLVALCHQMAGGENAPTVEDLIKLGAVALESGIQDPLIDACNAMLIGTYGAGENPRNALQLMARADASISAQPYPPVPMLSFFRWRGRLMQERRDMVLAANQIHLAVSEEDLNDFDRQMLAATVDRTIEFMGTLPGHGDLRAPAVSSDIASCLQPSATADPWLRHILLAREHVRLAWQARGSGYASTVSEDGSRQFAHQLTRARAHAVRAWEMKPHLPEAAVEMIRIAMGGQEVAGEGTRFWFDEAMEADFTFADAYQHYVWSIRPRWGGSHKEMLALAQECVATERFDTDVPEQFRTIVEEVAKERGEWRTVVDESIYDGFAKLLAGYAHRRGGDPDAVRRDRSQLAALAYLAGRREEVRGLMDELGTAVDRQGMSSFGVAPNEIVRSLRADDAEVETYFEDDPGGAMALAFVAQGRQLLVADRSGKLHLWDLKSKKLIRTLDDGVGSVLSLYPSADSKRLLTVSREGQAIAWDTNECKPSASLPTNSPIAAAAWSSDGTQVAVVSVNDGKSIVSTWNPDSGEETREEITSSATPLQIAWGPQEQGLVFSLPDTSKSSVSLHLSNLDDMPWQGKHFESQLTAWTPSRNGKQVVVAGVDFFERWRDKPSNVIKTIDYERGGVSQSTPWIPGKITALTTLSDQARVAGLCDEGSVFVWNSATGSVEGCWRTGVGGLQGLVSSPDDLHLAAIDRRGRIHVWPLNEGQLAWKIEAPLLDINLGGWVRNITFAKPNRLTVESAFGGLSVWDTSRACRAAEQYVFGSFPAGFSLYPDGHRAARLVPPGESTLEVVNLSDGKPLKSWSGQAIVGAVVSPDGKLLAVGDQTGLVSIVDADTLEPMPWGTLREHQHPVVRLAFSADGQSLVTASADGVLKWWDLPANRATTASVLSRLTLEITKDPYSPDQSPECVVISPDSSQLAVSKAVTDVFDTATGKRLYAVDGRNAVAFSPDGERLCTGAMFTDLLAAKVYDARSGQEQLVLSGGHGSAITAVAFSADSRTILTGSFGGEVRAWNAQTGDELLDWPAASDP